MSSQSQQIPLELGPFVGEIKFPEPQLLTPDDVLELFKARYSSIPRKDACKQLCVGASNLSDYLSGRRKVHRSKRILRKLGLRVIERFELIKSNGKDKENGR